MFLLESSFKLLFGYLVIINRFLIKVKMYTYTDTYIIIINILLLLKDLNPLGHHRLKKKKERERE